VFSHSWLATVHDVLQADWHEVWHSPQPLPLVVFNVGFAIVLICFILNVSFHNPCAAMRFRSHPACGHAVWLYSFLPATGIRPAPRRAAHEAERIGSTDIIIFKKMDYYKSNIQIAVFKALRP
jgi:hypothetical protein